MSFVSMIATNQFISVVADGMMTSTSGYAESNYKKFRVVNNSAVIALAGSYYNFEGLFSEFESVLQSGASESQLRSISSRVSGISYSSSSSKVLALAAGFYNGRGLYVTARNDGGGVRLEQLDSQVKYVFLSPDDVSEFSIQSHLKMLFSTHIVSSIQNVQGIQHSLNDFVAAQSSSVNTQTRDALIFNR